MNPLGSQSDTHFWPWAEIGLLLTVALGLLALWKPAIGETFFHQLEHSLSRFAKRKSLAVCLMFLGVVAVRIAVLPLLPVPIPGIHDEFSYLLMADTFAHGRLANPTHPMWMSFETFHVNWVRTYSSMYPPAQGFVMAIGQLLGNPWIGVLLSDAAMCDAMLCMLQAWMPARWQVSAGRWCWERSHVSCAAPVRAVPFFSGWVLPSWRTAVLMKGFSFVFRRDCGCFGG